MDSDREPPGVQVAVPHAPKGVQDATAGGRVDIALANVGVVVRVDGESPLDRVISDTLAERDGVSAPRLPPAPCPKNGICQCPCKNATQGTVSSKRQMRDVLKKIRWSDTYPDWPD
jgi:hypothetical protein